tara:strand:+ start:28301 stop:29230 length:930 start_codon:yes stop_codon:yes gene_type:complete
MNNKKALVISGGGSKGAFAGGVAQYLIQQKQNKYDLFLGTSTGSLMVSHLAMDKIEELKSIYMSVNQSSIFDINPFRIQKKNGVTLVNIRHRSTLLNFLRGSKTFGESNNLRRLIRNSISREMYKELVDSQREVVVTVSNLSTNQVEYKSCDDFSYDDFCDWIWASCNYVPFMSLLEKDGYQYADGGFGCLVPIREAILRGAKEIDVIVLETEISQLNRLPAKNPFSLLFNTFEFMLEHVEKHNITIGKLSARHRDVKLNLYYTPTVLTTNSLVFDNKEMKKWWRAGFVYARNKDKEGNDDFDSTKVDL